MRMLKMNAHTDMRCFCASLEAEAAEYDLKIAKLNGLSLMLDALEYV